VYRAIQTHYQILALTEELAVDLTKHHAHHDAAPKRVHFPDSNIRGTAYMQQGIPRGWTVLDSSKIDTDKSLTHPQTDPYVDTSSNDKQSCDNKLTMTLHQNACIARICF
jgi:hypothetical protein